MSEIQLVFYWVATFALGLMGLFVIVAIIVMLMLAAKINQVARSAHHTMREVREAMHAVKSRARGFGAGFMSGFWKMVLNMLRG